MLDTVSSDELNAHGMCLIAMEDAALKIYRLLYTHICVDNIGFSDGPVISELYSHTHMNQ